MHAIHRNPPTPHSEKIERWLGSDGVSRLQANMKGWHGGPIGIANLPGVIRITPDGDFVGTLHAHERYATLVDIVLDKMGKAYARYVRRGGATLHTGFSGFADLVAEYTAGKRNVWGIQKTGPTGVVGVTSSLWGVGAQPAAGANASNAPAGDAPTDATVGALPFTNPSGGDTQHFLRADIVSNVANQLLMYDRLFQVNKTMNSTGNETVTGVPTRYQSTTPTDQDYAGGNFLFFEVGGTALAATNHNWDAQYTDESGNATQALPTLTGVNAAIVRRLDHVAGQWFAPLASGDIGIKALTRVTCSALVATGVLNVVIGHPIAWIPCPLVNLMVPTDGLRGPLNLTRIFDDAALALLEVTKPVTTSSLYAGTIETVYG